VSDDSDPINRGLPHRDEPSTGGRLSPEVVRSWHETHGRELFEFLIGVLRDPIAAQDVLQITFRRVLETGHTAREETAKGWLFKVALREALVFRRQLDRQQRHLKKYAAGQDSLVDPGLPEFQIVRDEDVARLRQLLVQLPADQQHVIRQRIYEDKTFAEIASELNVPLGTVLTRMRLAVEKLRKWFGRR
jgi:RNA polymerase sigma factor (sigma-70 family)